MMLIWKGSGSISESVREPARVIKSSQIASRLASTAVIFIGLHINHTGTSRSAGEPSAGERGLEESDNAADTDDGPRRDEGKEAKLCGHRGCFNGDLTGAVTCDAPDRSPPVRSYFLWRERTKGRFSFCCSVSIKGGCGRR